MEQTLLCPYGGDETNDCEDCAYSIDFHFENGECVLRKEKFEYYNSQNTLEIDASQKHNKYIKKGAKE